MATRAKKPVRTKTAAKKTKPNAAKKKPVLLSGGNPQIAKGDGAAPVKAYLAALPGWKKAAAKKVHALVEANIPKLEQAVKWNSPFYGREGMGYAVSVHALNKAVRVTFFKGGSLKPLPPGGTEKSGEGRWVDVTEEGVDERQLAHWIRQAGKLPGWTP